LWTRSDRSLFDECCREGSAGAAVGTDHRPQYDECVLTETLTFVSPDATASSARERVEVLARDLGLTIVSLDETPHRSSTQLKITLTGPADRISDFQDATAGNGLSSTNYNPGDVIITSVLQRAHERSRRWRRARRERKLGA
jgi:hypothetical protein